MKIIKKKLVIKNIEESEDEMIDSDISECLKAAGVQLNEFFFKHR